MALHPKNTEVGAGATLLERIDFFFSDPKQSLAVGSFFQKETARIFSAVSDAKSLTGSSSSTKAAEVEGDRGTTNGNNASKATNRTDSSRSLLLFDLFKKYGHQVIDVQLASFCQEQSLPLDDVAIACVQEMNRLEGAPSQFIFLPYVCAAVNFDSFCQLLEDFHVMYQTDDAEMEDADDSDETSEDDETDESDEEEEVNA